MIAGLSRWLGWSRRDAPAWIDIAALRRRHVAGDGVVVVDVREPEEFAAPPGHLPGAVNIPLGTVAGRAGELAALDRPIVVVCKTDRRSARAAETLVASGLRDVAVLRGGTDGWHRQGLPLE
jgi:rhodanese-related sulfurtransferase